MKQIFILLLNVILIASLSAQDVKVTAKLYKDTVGFEEKIQITFSIENTQNVDFEAPKFKDFAASTRTGTSTNMSFVNGEMTQSVSYNYILEHHGAGIYVIEPAIVEINGEIYQSDIIEVVVSSEATTPNPISETDRMMNRFRMDNFNLNLDDFFNNMPQFEIPDIPLPQPKSDKKKEEKKKPKKKIYKI